MSDVEKKIKRSISDAKRSIKNLQAMNLNIEIHETETMIGTVLHHVYVVDRINGKVCFQKYLFSIAPNNVH